MGKIVSLSGTASGRGSAKAQVKEPTYLRQLKESIVVGFLSQNPDVVDLIVNSVNVGEDIDLSETDWPKWAEHLSFEIPEDLWAGVTAEIILYRLKSALTNL